MAFSFGFYNSFEHDRMYDAIQVSKIFDGIISDGVYATYEEAFVVKESENEGQVIVSPGRAWFDHTWNYNDAPLPIQAPLSDLILQRIDALVIDIRSDVDTRENSIIWVTGIPSQYPQKPILINESEHHQYPLAYVTRNANIEVIKQENIENAVGTSECPFVTGIIDTINIDSLLLQWSGQINTLIYEHTQRFLNWFQELRYILDGDVAGHLLNLIQQHIEDDQVHAVGDEKEKWNRASSNWAGCWIEFTNEKKEPTTEPYIHWYELVPD